METVFIPSHLTKGLIGLAVTLLAGIYTAWELSQVEREEVDAFLGREEVDEHGRSLPAPAESTR